MRKKGKKFQRGSGKLVCLILLPPDNCYIVGQVSQRDMKDLRKFGLLPGFVLILFAGCEKSQEEVPLTFEIHSSQDCFNAEEGLKLHFSGLPSTSSSQLEWYIWVAESEEEINISENNIALKSVTGTNEIILPDSFLQNADVVVATVYFFHEGRRMQTKYHSYSKTNDPSDCVEWKEANS